MKFEICQGIIDLPDVEYRAADAVSKSDLDLIAISPAHYKWKKLNPVSSLTPALIIGSAFHRLVLEPDIFHIEYVRVPDKSRANKGYKEVAEALEPVGKKVLLAEEWDQIHRMKESLEKDGEAMTMLKSGKAEQSFFWKDPIEDVWCKCRPDVYTEDGFLFDLKSAHDATPSGFLSACKNSRFPVQAASYSEALRIVANIEVRGFVFVLVEKEPPHGVAKYEISPDGIKLGLKVYRDNLARFAECKRKDEWPGYPKGIQEIEMPKWMFN